MDHKFNKHFIMFFICFFHLLVYLGVLGQTQLSYNYYDSSCPNLSSIIRNGVGSAILNETRMGASLLRMHFHDCFVNGCDGSVLLDNSTSIVTEKDALPNINSLRGFEVIDSIKASVESTCPSTVSCADIVTLAARDAVYLAGGPYWPVPLGRRDGTTANRTAANLQLPTPFDSMDVIISKFAGQGLSVRDVVALSGAHTIGFAHCSLFKSRLFDFNKTTEPDPTLNKSILTKLQNLCPNVTSSNSNLAPLDLVTTNSFDNMYYQNLMNGSAVLQSDEALLSNDTTASIVANYSKYPFFFSWDFGASMIKMGGIGVITGQNGEVRTNCRVVN